MAAIVEAPSVQYPSHTMHRLLSSIFRKFATPDAPTQPLAKPAIALITYCRFDYFAQVYKSISEQAFFAQFDFYIFQDGLLDNATPEQRQGHQAIASFCANQPHAHHYTAQPKNLGVALHFDCVERALFVQRDHPWVAFCEDDLVLAPGYLETLACMAASFKDDPRVAMFSCFGHTFNKPLEIQNANQQALTSMEHHWGFGMHQTAWRRRQPLVDEYLKLFATTPYHEREHGRIQNWHSFCGFKTGATSQDYAKACAIAAQGAIKVSSFANFGTYIGAYGLHFTPEIYAKKGYANSTIFPSAITQRFQLDDETYQRLLKQQQALTIAAPETFDTADFARRLQSGSFAPSLADQWQKNLVTEADVVAAYKIFLGRLPEARQVIESRIGIAPDQLLISFITAPEFRARKKFNPIILALAKEIIDQSKQSTPPSA